MNFGYFRWARRMQRTAAWTEVAALCGYPTTIPFPKRLEKVKFGFPLEEVCKDDLPGPLLVLLLRLNKDAPLRKDVFRAPGHQGAMKKLIHFLQCGRLVNVENYSSHTIASVLKKFLGKIPGGIFGRQGEMQLFAAVDLPEEEQLVLIRRLIRSLPDCTQRLLVMLLGTFRVVATNSEKTGTGMTSEALGVSVAPSFFLSCVADGKTATMEDVQRFKVATRIMRFMIEEFSTGILFKRDHYVYYVRMTGRVLRVGDEWICSFIDPPPPRHLSELEAFARHFALQTGKTWLQCECERWLKMHKDGAAAWRAWTAASCSGLSNADEYQSMPVLNDHGAGTSSNVLGIIPEHCLLDSCTRLSVSLEENVFKVAVGSSSSSGSPSSPHMTLDELRAINAYAESTKSLSYLPQVHERQRARMATRSEWFLQPASSVECARSSGEQRRSSRRGSRRARLCGGGGGGGGGSCRGLSSDSEVALALQPRKVTA